MWDLSSATLTSGRMKDLFSLIESKLQDPEAFNDKIDFMNQNIDSESIDEVNLTNGKHFERYSKPYKVQNKVVGRVWSFRDITETRKLHAALLYSATHDKLTRLPNRRLMNDRITQNILLAKRQDCLAAVLLFDLDRFKNINDSLGHTAGDSVLRLVASRVTRVLREVDTLARLGGDEFVVTVSNIDNKAQIEHLANKVLDVIKKPFKIHKLEFYLTGSMGISLYPKDGSSVDDLLQKADGAMYRVKKNGRNGLKFCETDEGVKTLKLLSLENDLRKAIEENQFVLHYQPLIELPSGNIVGVEALIRWNHPTQGLLMPADFLQIAEETGLIVPIGEWVLKTACMQNKLWQEEHLTPLKIAVNVSSTQFKMPKFSELISNTLKETKLESQYLELELTEMVIADNPELMLEVLNKIKELGVGLVIDDFGTGYSSLSYIKQYPFNKLKIDRSFVKNIYTNEDDSNLVKSIIAMARNLKLKVVAEGVETEKQLLVLSGGKCDLVQGYLLSSPIDALALANYLRNHPTASSSSGSL